MSRSSRRTFLKQTAAGAALPWVMPGAGEPRERPAGAQDAAVAQTPASPAAGASAKPASPRGAVAGVHAGPALSPEAAAIPTCASLRSVEMPHVYGDLFNPPGLTNFLGCAQAALDIVGVRSLSFPPFAQGEQSTAVMASGELVTGVLYVDGEYFTAAKQPVAFAWQPDRVERRASYKGFDFDSTMIVPFDTQAAAVALRVRNSGRTARTVEIKLALRGGVSKSVTPWNAAYSPAEFDNGATVDRARGAVLFTAAHSAACAVQGSWPVADEVTASWLVYRLTLKPGQTWRCTFVIAMDEQPARAQETYDRLVRDFDGAAAAVRREWDAELAAVYTPGNDRYSGHLPLLVTTDEAVRRLYHMAAMTTIFFKRTSSHSVYGRTYVTLAPRYWQTTTFLWDISLSSMLLAQLDPATLRAMIENWMQMDVHKHVGSEYLTGAGVGPWYSVNDFAMCRMSREYLRWTGDRAWLDREVGGVKVIDRLVSYATHWRALDVNGHGLADYGGVLNLLEAVSNYVHEVAGLNAANVFNLRFAADLLEARGDAASAQQAGALRDEARQLIARVLDLYVAGEGTWSCQLPDGSRQVVRHCYDFGTVLWAIGADLDDTRKREMVRFFQAELQSPAWMRALSTRDLDVTFSIRPDHQWTGAYCAWPAIALSALYRAGQPDVAHKWIAGLANSTRQGPIAQAHFAETAVPPEAGGGARKAPSDQPYINDWACVAGGAYLEPIIDSLFGIDAGLFGAITSHPQFARFDPKAELRNLRYQGKNYIATRDSVRLAERA
jgi:hypothetical protein